MEIKKHFPNFLKRENITALSMIIVIGGISFVTALSGMAYSRHEGLKAQKAERHSAYQDELRRLSGITTNLAPIPDPTAEWKTYKNESYSFSIKYPNDWQVPTTKAPSSGERYLLKISFEGQSAQNGGEGAFDAYIFRGSILDFVGAGNLMKKNELLPTDVCPRFDDITLGQEGYPAKEINVTAENPCWKETFFYSLSENGFTYVIVPRFGSRYNIENFNEGESLVKFHPLFFDVVSTLDLSKKEVVAETVKKIVTPPKARFTSGASCNHKNDKPRKSKTKGKHMDEDCCPDPDEWPNPRCAYSGGGLGLMRSGPK